MDDMKEHLSEAEKLINEVDEKLDSGSEAAAKNTFNRDWRDAVPDLPLRFSVILSNINIKNIKQILEKTKGYKYPQLTLFLHEGGISVKMSRGRKLTIGMLPEADSQMLLELGNKAVKAYKPVILELGRNDQGGIIYIAVELIRKEKKSKEAAMKDNPEDIQKYTPVAVQEAFEELNKNEDINLPKKIDF